jgi:hypothetical protein
MLGVANSELLLQYYDLRFNNRLYANRRRFMTQYVEKFPIPDPNKKESKEIINITKEYFYSKSINFKEYQLQVGFLVQKAFK